MTERRSDAIVMTGVGHVVLTPADEAHTVDPRCYLKQRKTRKFMGVQDDLAVMTAAYALDSAGLLDQPLGERTGLYLVVGHIPFEEETIDGFVDASVSDGATFDMKAFSTAGLESVSPLMTFRCLPNMPLFHISSNFDIQGPYCVSYPGPGQFYAVLEQACMALADGRIDRALVGGVAAQRNFLVRHHYRRLTPPVPSRHLADAAGMIVLERADVASRRSALIRSELVDVEFGYRRHDPFQTSFVHEETIDGPEAVQALLKWNCGSASLPVALSLLDECGEEGVITHALESRDGIIASSQWGFDTESATTHSGAFAHRGFDCEPTHANRLSPPYRVVVTGMGVVTPIGSDVASFRDNLLSGQSGIGPITLFDPAFLPTRIAAEADLRPEAIDLRDRKISFAMEAARQAMEAAHARGDAPGLESGGRHASLSLGVGLEVFAMEDMVAYRRQGAELPSEHRERLTFLQTPSDLCLHLISNRYGLDAPPLSHVSACAAGTDAIGAAFRLIAEGRRRWMLAGGTDSMINPLGVGGFCLLNAMSTQNERPTEASRPFDRARDGFVLGEGAAVLVLERLEDALARGAEIHAEVLGYGNSFDAHAITAPHPEGRGAFQAMQRALKTANLDSKEIDCINAHATATPLSDSAETLALKTLLGERAHVVPVCANKSMIGHLISASGAVEAVAAIACMEVGRVPPTINLDEPDPACDLDYVPGRAREFPHQHVMSNSLGFGGMNASLVFRRFDHVGG